MNRDAGSELQVSRVDLATTPDFNLGDLSVRPSHRQVCHRDSLRRRIEPRVMQVLVALASSPAEVVSRDRLIERCWNGRIVGDDAINRCIVALRHLAREFAPEPFEIGTVARVGYYLVEGCARAPDRPPVPVRPLTPAAPPSRLPRPALAALLAGAIALALFGLAFAGRARRSGR